MPPRARPSTVRGDLTSGLRLDQGIMAFDFQPTIGILARAVDKLGLDIESFEEPLTRAVREVMIPSIDQNFASQGRPRWEPLSEVTLAIRQREGSGNKILQRTGRLREAATSLDIWDIDGERAVIKELPQDVWYGTIHQAGYGSMGGAITSQIRKGASASEAARRVQSDLDARLREAMRTGTRVKARSAAPIPARPFVVIQPEDEERIVDVFDQWLGEKMGEAGFR